MPSVPPDPGGGEVPADEALGNPVPRWGWLLLVIISAFAALVLVIQRRNERRRGR